MTDNDNTKKNAALRSIVRWATDEKLTTAERINIIAHQPQVRAASQEAPASPAAGDFVPEYSFITAPIPTTASPSPGLREAVIEECAKEISNLWFSDLERKLIIRAQAAIRALSRPKRGQP